ncbi:MAG TPA: hypothetical protein VLC30_15195 [Pseudomonas sp.]|nr:hypothetical protein [Pseudomonas sp.]
MSLCSALAEWLYRESPLDIGLSWLGWQQMAIWEHYGALRLWAVSLAMADLPAQASFRQAGATSIREGLAQQKWPRSDTGSSLAMAINDGQAQ